MREREREREREYWAKKTSNITGVLMGKKRKRGIKEKKITNSKRGYNWKKKRKECFEPAG